MYRKSMDRNKDKKHFSKSADKVNSKNLTSTLPKRGGTRL